VQYANFAQIFNYFIKKNRLPVPVAKNCQFQLLKTKLELGLAPSIHECPLEKGKGVLGLLLESGREVLL